METGTLLFYAEHVEQPEGASPLHSGMEVERFILTGREKSTEDVVLTKVRKARTVLRKEGREVVSNQRRARPTRLRLYSSTLRLRVLR